MQKHWINFGPSEDWMEVADVDERFRVIESQVRGWNGATGVVSQDTHMRAEWDPWLWTEPVRCGRVAWPEATTGV